jgi:DNA-binding response OmpR family regulator
VCNVLVIDDEIMIRDMLSQALSRLDFTVDTAESALGGIAKFDNGTYDLVITDVRMPGVDGRHVVHHIRGSKRDTTPVIGLSGTPRLLQNGGFDAVLDKPFVIQSLIEKVKDLAKAPMAR